MPTSALKKMAADRNLSLQKAEELWEKAKKIAEEEGWKSDAPDYYAYVTGIWKKSAGDGEEETSAGDHLYYVQPDGSWKKGGDRRGGGLTLKEVKARKGKICASTEQARSTTMSLTEKIKGLLPKEQAAVISQWRKTDSSVTLTLEKNGDDKFVVTIVGGEKNVVIPIDDPNMTQDEMNAILWSIIDEMTAEDGESFVEVAKDALAKVKHNPATETAYPANETCISGSNGWSKPELMMLATEVESELSVDLTGIPATNVIVHASSYGRVLVRAYVPWEAKIQSLELLAQAVNICANRFTQYPSVYTNIRLDEAVAGGRGLLTEVEFSVQVESWRNRLRR